MGIESFQTQTLQNIIPSYLYQEYASDDNLQAFVNSQNALTQGYIDWFNTTPLGVYTSPSITGPLLDWTATGIYDIARPVLASGSTTELAGYATAFYNQLDYNGIQTFSSGTSIIASDDIYKRVLTWNLYRGDGQIFSLDWLKRRIARFLYGDNGSDANVLDEPINITVSNGVFTVTNNATTIFTVLQLAYANGALAFPFQYSMAFIAVSFINNGGLLQMNNPLNYPLSPTGLAAGAVYYNNGLICVAGTTSPVAAPALYFSTITPEVLLSTGGSNLPLTQQTPGSGQLWNDGGCIAIS
jgi:hypothetical protein